METTFYLLLFLVFYGYVGYPVLLVITAFFFGRKVSKKETYPFVSIIIAAYNEEKHIKDKIVNTLSLDYPRDRIEILVVSDGSTDHTNEIVSSFNDGVIKLFGFPQRNGKTYVQNEAAKSASGEILLFSDATTVYEKTLLKEIIWNFADSNVGAVGAELVYVNKDKTTVGEGGGLYWKYEKFLKRKESEITSLIGVSGCCYAVRKELYDPIPANLISDFVIAQLVYKKGKRVIYEPQAVCYEETNSTASDEFNMRVRVGVRTLFGLWRMKKLLNPFKYGFFSLELISHKIFRYLIPIFLVTIFLTNLYLVLAGGSKIFLVPLSLQIFFYSLSIIGALFKTNNRCFYIPYYFSLTNYALLISLLLFLKGEKHVIWNPLRK